MAVDIYNVWCLEQGLPLFPVTPLALHKCSCACNFFIASRTESVCMASRQIHVCTSTCSERSREEREVCQLTHRDLGAKMGQSYWDGTSTLISNKQRSPFLDRKQMYALIYETLHLLFHGAIRSSLEEKANRRQASSDQVAIIKEARRQKLHRGNWHSYFKLFLAHSTIIVRRLATAANLNQLAKNILLFWNKVFVEPESSHRRVQTFVAVCVSQLVDGTSSIFPLIPWIKQCAPVQSLVYCLSLNITCRIMTAMLMEIRDVSLLRPIGVFPLSL